MNSRIHIFTGHFGSGKTEVAVNFAVRSANPGTVIVDMDTVNPYFRTAELKNRLERCGIEVICSDFAASNVDIPILVPSAAKVFYDESLHCVFDVGGDEDGAYALGVYRNLFQKYGYEMHFVVNTKRPLTETAEDIIELMEKIEAASGLKITDIVNNTNIGKNTDYDTLMSGRYVIDEVCAKKGLGVAFNSGIKSIGRGEKDFFGLDIYMKKPWEQ
ncbi:MAG: hypothetical protein J1F64_00060 [Oscillospiraceae bacterium]|nr:hypothetical protein [Oscillospiraceae bacterium]